MFLACVHVLGRYYILSTQPHQYLMAIFQKNAFVKSYLTRASFICCVFTIVVWFIFSQSSSILQHVPEFFKEGKERQSGKLCLWVFLITRGKGKMMKCVFEFRLRKKKNRRKVKPFSNQNLSLKDEINWEGKFPFVSFFSCYSLSFPLILNSRMRC